MFDDTRGCQPTFHRIFHRIWPFYPHCTGMFGEFFHMFFPLKLHNLWISFICFIVFPIFLVDFPIDFFHDPHLFPISRWTTPNPPLDDPSELGLQLFHMRLHQSSGLAQGVIDHFGHGTTSSSWSPWIGSRENLPETHGFLPWKNRLFLYLSQWIGSREKINQGKPPWSSWENRWFPVEIVPTKPIHWHAP